MLFSSVLGLVANFFMTIFNMVFRIQFFEGFSMGSIALMLLVIVSLFDLIVQFSGRSVNDGVSAAEDFRSSRIDAERSYHRAYDRASARIMRDMNNPGKYRSYYYRSPKSHQLRSGR